MNKFIMLVGLPGSGKSYKAKCIQNELGDTSVLLSSDEIRKELYGAEEIQGNADEVFRLMNSRTKDALSNNCNVIFDACNINSKKRIAFLNELSKFKCEKICIICATPYKKCIENDLHRKRIVTKRIIKKMYTNWNTPFYFEGWDEIKISYFENAENSYGNIMDFVEEQMNYSQDTPYHEETLGQHLKGCAEYLMNKYGYEVNSNMVNAAYLHDCGKPFTKVYTDAKGNKTEIAHFYRHENVSAYNALFFDYEDKTEKDILEISAIIGLHMGPFSWSSEKTNDKFRKLWGNTMYEMIMRIHEADEAASIRKND